jgi:outer membrane protein OmpA-like peptidoglycan-associated protein
MRFDEGEWSREPEAAFESGFGWTGETRETRTTKPSPPRVQTGPEVCGKQKGMKFPKDQPALDITGRYFTKSPHATYVFNHAGLHVEGFAGAVIGAGKRPGGAYRPLTEIQATLKDGKYYEWFDRNDPSRTGRILERGGHFFLGKEWLRPIERRATLMGSAYKLPIADRDLTLVERHELTPLTPTQMQFIDEILKKSVLDEIFRLYFNDNQQAKALSLLYTPQVITTRAGQRHVGGIVETRDPKQNPNYQARLETVHEVELPLVRLYAEKILTINKWTSSRNVTRSHADWIQIMLDMKVPADAPMAREFKRYIGLSPHRFSGEGNNIYEFTLQLTGASLILAGYTGSVLVEEKTGRKWKKEFDIDLWGGTVALSLGDVKIGDTFTGVAHSHIAWTENDIVGSVRLAKASASAGLEVASANAGFMHVLGNGTYPPLHVIIWSGKLGVPDPKKFAEEMAKGGPKSSKDVLVDVSASVLTGSISHKGTLLDKMRLAKKGPAPIDLSRTWKSDLSQVRGLSSEIHFCLDTAEPTAAARQALRVLCARELPSFLTPGTTLTVVGHADTLISKRASPDYNKNLSKRRAEQTIQAMKDILGMKFRINDKNIVVVPLGEKLAAQASGGKTVAAPQHRRVQIFMNSVLVLTLFGPSGP